jgi:predicted component of type VI protein secretion system
MDLKLKVLEGKNAGQEISVNGKKFFIGRAEDCHLRPGSDLISRHHCVLLVEDGYIGIRDFGSKNGTYVNDERVAGERELKAGDRLTVGPLRFEIHVAHNIGAKKRPPVGDIKEAAARTAQVAAAAQGGMDVDAWISDAPPGETKATDTHQPNLAETDSIKLANTQTVYHSPNRPAPVVQTPAPVAPAPVAPAPTAQAPVAQVPAPVAQAPVVKAPAPVAQAPAPAAAPVAPAPQPVAKASPPPNVYQAPPEEEPAAEQHKGPAGKRTPGKLPVMPNASKDSQEAAAAMLNKLRKRR